VTSRGEVEDREARMCEPDAAGAVDERPVIIRPAMTQSFDEPPKELVREVSGESADATHQSDDTLAE